MKTMREFNEADRNKKKTRIQLKENTGNLSGEALSKLEEAVKASLKEGYLPCPVAWKLAKDAGVPKIAVGEITDRLGIRVTDCQLGCFKLDKTVQEYPPDTDVDSEVVSRLETLKENNKLTCAGVFDLARQLKLKPMAIADMMNIRKLKIHDCQLGCF
jgi:hypothetical protein